MIELIIRLFDHSSVLRFCKLMILNSICIKLIILLSVALWFQMEGDKKMPISIFSENDWMQVMVSLKNGLFI